MGGSQGLRSPTLSSGRRSPGSSSLPSYSDGVSSGTKQFPFASYDEKYPPSQPSTIEVPLLHADDPSSRDDSERRNSRTALRSPPSSAIFPSRTRLHPLTLFPAFILGILLAMTGIFGTSTYFRKPVGVLQNSYSLNRSNDVRSSHSS